MTEAIQPQGQAPLQTPPQTIVVGQQPIGVRQSTPGGSSSLPIPPARPHRRHPVLSHADMVAAIRAGGSVIHNGEIIAHEQFLPTEAELAQGDADREAAARESLDAQIAALSRQRALVTPAEKPADAKSSDKAPADKPKS